MSREYDKHSKYDMPETVDVNFQEMAVREYERSEIEDMCKSVSNGGSVIQYCEQKGINYGDFMFKLRRDPVWHRIYLQAQSDRDEWIKEQLIVLLQKINSADIKHLFNENGNYVGVQDLPSNVTQVIKKLKVKLQSNGPDEAPDEILEVEFYDKQKSIDLLGKYVQMFIERVVVHNVVSLEDSVHKSWNVKDVNE